MNPSNNKIHTDYLKIFLVILLVVITTFLHFSTKQSQYYYHIVFRELYFLPILLAAFWFGVRGGLVASVGISALYLPLVIMHWQNFSPEDLDKSLEILLFNVVALVMGILSDREKKREREKREEILAMAGTIAHELNSPLQVVLGNTEFLQDEFEPESETYRELQTIINNTKTIRDIVKKISFLDRFALKEYVGDEKIVDISGG
ncbi:MAG: DUF4118 domain-containing protein [Thermodesulfobacteriota bacterium]|nr:DUF4118 domain-containing protein [Thermodesulfobacteriota bacterium]